MVILVPFGVPENLQLSSYGQPKSKYAVFFAKIQNGRQRFGLALKFVDQKSKVVHFCGPLEEFKYWNQFKLLFEGHFDTLWGSSSPLAVELQPAEVRKSVFAKRQNGCFGFGLALKFVDQKQKMLLFVN